MIFKILGSRKKGRFYEFVIEGEEDAWDFNDILTIMKNAVSSHSDYFIEGHNIRERISVYRRAEMNLEETAIKGIRKLVVRDENIGKQMIEKFVYSIETN